MDRSARIDEMLDELDRRYLLAEIDDRIAQHRLRLWWPWRCRCGRRRPCPAREVVDTELLRQWAREAADWYPQYFATQRTDGGSR